MKDKIGFEKAVHSFQLNKGISLNPENTAIVPVSNERFLKHWGKALDESIIIIA